MRGKQEPLPVKEKGPLRLFLERHFDSWNDICLHESARLRTMNILFYFAIGLTCFLMSIMNFVTREYEMMAVTLAIAAIFLTLFFALFFGRNILRQGMVVLTVSLWLMSAYFMYTGGVNGFSIVWILLIPAFSYLILPSWAGHLFSLSALLLVFFSLATPLHQYLAYEYSDVVRFRFPAVMAFVVLCGAFGDVVRQQTQKRLSQITHNFKEQAFTDALTGTGNRHAFRNDCSFLDKDASFACAIADVDFFKDINDTFGHDVGDEVLKDVANLLRERLRPTDRIYRWGGEEFAMLLHGISEEMLSQALERLRAAVAEYRFYHQEIPLPPITISIGGAFGCQGKDINDCIKKADACLYEAKGAGRNRVVVAQVE